MPQQNETRNCWRSSQPVTTPCTYSWAMTAAGRKKSVMRVSRSLTPLLTVVPSCVRNRHAHEDIEQFNTSLCESRGFRFPLPLRVWGSVFPCSCEFEVPFGRSRCRFNVLLWVSEMRVVFVRGGRPNGMVQFPCPVRSRRQPR